MWRLLTQVQRVMHGVRVDVRVGRVRWMWMVVGRVRQRRMVVSLSSPLSLPPLSGQTHLLRGRPLGLRDDDVGVMEEGSGAQAVVVHRLGVSLQVALHVLRVEGEVGA